jgi:hypothetical protein
VVPPAPGSNLDGRELLALPPFVQPQAERQRQLNYWLMGKRVVTLPFNLTACGIALTLYAVFVLLCDLGPLRIGVFRTFGTNPLATYIIHEMVDHAVKIYAPANAPLWYAGVSFAVFVGITYLCVRSLEKNGIYLRL